MPTPTPINYQKIKIIAIQQQPKAQSPQTVIFDIYRVKSTAPQNSDFSLSHEQQTSDFKRAIDCQDCPIPNPLTDAQKLDFQKDMFNYTVLRNVEIYGIDKKSQKVDYFRTYFISEMPNGWEEIHYQLNPNEYPFAYSKIV